MAVTEAPARKDPIMTIPRVGALAVASVPAALLVACSVDVASHPEAVDRTEQAIIPAGPPPPPSPVTSFSPPRGEWHAEIAVGDTTIVTSDSSNIDFWDRYGNKKATVWAPTLFQTFSKGGSPQNLNQHLPLPNGSETWQQCTISTYGLDVLGNSPPDPLRNLHYQSSCITSGVYDVHSTYDPVHHRFVIVGHMRNMIWAWPTEGNPPLCTTDPGNFPGGVPSPCYNNPGAGTDPYAWRFLVIAVSKTEDPTSVDPSDITKGFNFYASQEFYSDFPRVGVSGNYFVASYHGETSLNDLAKPLVTLWDMDDLAAGAASPRQFGYTESQLAAGSGSPGPLGWTQDDFVNRGVGFLVVPSYDPLPSTSSSFPAQYGTAFLLSKAAHPGDVPRLFAFTPSATGDRNAAPHVSETSMPSSYAGVDIPAASIRGSRLWSLHAPDMQHVNVDSQSIAMNPINDIPSLTPRSSTTLSTQYQWQYYYDPMLEVASNGAAVVGYSFYDNEANRISLRSTTLMPDGQQVPEHEWATGPACNQAPAAGAPGCPDSYVGINRISIDPLDRSAVWILGGIGVWQQTDAGVVATGGVALQAQSVRVTDNGCAAGKPTDTFYNGVRGCGGSVTFDQRQALCGAGYTVCTAQQWTTLAQNPPFGQVGIPQVPSAHYWTDDRLNWGGSGPNSCEALPWNQGNDCGTVPVTVNGSTTWVPAPMRVCKPGSSPSWDGFGNECNWTGCGLGSTSPNLSFGGCSGDPTAGALCCPVTAGCANGAPDDVFPMYPTIDKNGVSHVGEVRMVGCGGSVTWDQRASLCGAGYSPCKASTWANAAQTWAALNTLPQPSADYWTDDNLGYGTEYWETSGDCKATTSPNCNAPMRVCTPNGPDSYGNVCNWTGCGLGSTTNEWFGGCSNDMTAGTLCCAD
jgi:hypothetical protein